MQSAQMACTDGPRAGPCLQADEIAELDIVKSASRDFVFLLGRSRSIPKSILLPKRNPSLAKLPKKSQGRFSFMSCYARLLH